jgi:hypothetical protein
MEQNSEVPRDRQRHLPDASFKYSSSSKLATVIGSKLSTPQGGFWMEENSKCRVIGNDIYQNQKSGIQVGGLADPKKYM